MNKYMGVGGFILADTCMEEYQPWLRPDSARYIENMLPKNANVFEWGAGASTIWLAKRGYTVTSFEIDHNWLNKIHGILVREGLSDKVKLLGFSSYNIPDYTDSILWTPDDSYDLVLIDGRNRCRCLGNSRSKVKVCGILCLDNSEREEYSKAFKLMDTWDGYTWGDEGWSTTVWTRLSESETERVIFPNEDA